MIRLFCRDATIREEQKFFKVREKSGNILVLVKIREFCLRKWFRNLLKKEMHLLQRLKQKKNGFFCHALKSREKHKEIENEEKYIDGLQKKWLDLFDNLPNVRSVKIILRSVKTQGKVREVWRLL